MDYRYNNQDQRHNKAYDMIDDPYTFDDQQQPQQPAPGYPGQSTPLPGRGGPPPPQYGSRRQDYIAKNYNDFLERQGIPTISPEDMAILRECGRESLFYRCLPITAALCAGLMYTGRTRQIQPKFYHYLGAVFAGYFIGKMSYRSTCEEKLINSKSNSPFVNAIRKRRGLFVEEYGSDASLGPEASMESDWTTPSSSSMNKSYGIQEFDDESLNRKPTRNSPFQRDDFGDGSTDNLHSDSNVGGNVGDGVTYDDLRNRNRSMYKNI